MYFYHYHGDVIRGLEALPVPFKRLADRLNDFAGTVGMAGAEDLAQPLLSEHFTLGIGCLPDPVRPNEDHPTRLQPCTALLFEEHALFYSERRAVAGKLLETA